MAGAASLIDQALSLPTDQREELAMQLLLSLGDKDHRPLSRAEFERLIEQRVRQVESGEAETQDAFAALEEIRASLRSRSA